MLALKDVRCRISSIGPNLLTRALLTNAPCWIPVTSLISVYHNNRTPEYKTVTFHVTVRSSMKSCWTGRFQVIKSDVHRLLQSTPLTVSSLRTGRYPINSLVCNTWDVRNRYTNSQGASKFGAVMPSILLVSTGRNGSKPCLLWINLFLYSSLKISSTTCIRYATIVDHFKLVAPLSESVCANGTHDLDKLGEFSFQNTWSADFCNAC